MRQDTEKIFDELVMLMKRDPKSRDKLRKALYPEIERSRAYLEFEINIERLTALLNELSEVQKETEQSLTRLGTLFG